VFDIISRISQSKSVLAMYNTFSLMNEDIKDDEGQRANNKMEEGVDNYMERDSGKSQL
jgi:hypothetical protein